MVRTLIRSFTVVVLGLFAALGAWGEDVLSPSYDLTGSLKDVFDDPTNPEHIFLYLQTTDDISQQGFRRVRGVVQAAWLRGDADEVRRMEALFGDLLAEAGDPDMGE